MVPLAHAQYMLERLPNAELWFGWPRDGHVSILEAVPLAMEWLRDAENDVERRHGNRVRADRGRAPSVVLVGGGLDDGAENEPLQRELARAFTVINYTRRGRGESGDIQPYAAAAEIDDLEAVIDVAGGRAHVLGVSTGGALALEAAAAGAGIDRLAVYEVPYYVPGWDEYVATINTLLAGDRRDEALEHFMRTAGSSDEAIAAAKASEHWPGLLKLAHTLAYDAACLGESRPPDGVEQPVLVLSGSGDPFFEGAADAIAEALPNAERHDPRPGPRRRPESARAGARALLPVARRRRHNRARRLVRRDLASKHPCHWSVSRRTYVTPSPRACHVSSARSFARCGRRGPLRPAADRVRASDTHASVASRTWSRSSFWKTADAWISPHTTERPASGTRPAPRAALPGHDGDHVRGGLTGVYVAANQRV